MRSGVDCLDADGADAMGLAMALRSAAAVAAAERNMV